MMGTFVEVISRDRNAPEIVFKEIKRIEKLLSRFDPDSEISELNRSGKLLVSPETFYIIKKAKEFWQLTDGAFDITVGPLLEIWGFRDKNYRIPDRNEIKRALKSVGSDKIVLKEKNNMVKLKSLKVKLDLGAIATGYAIDCAVKRLREAGITSCLINAGGDIYCLGSKFGKPWKIAVQSPFEGKFSDFLYLENKAVATSGDYEKYFIKGGKRYSHIFNPKTGYPCDSGIASVTVIAQDSLTADFLSTAIFVLGKEKGEALAKQFPDTQLIFKNRDGS